MQISELTNFCNSNYSRFESKCPDCQNDCMGGCQQCMDAMHYRRVIRRYNCHNIVYYYVCRYIFRYSSEIDYLFQEVTGLRELPHYNILSIGCGPSTELYGIVKNMDTNNDHKLINYIGIDLNQIWKVTHEHTTMIMQQLPNTVNTHYEYKDIYKYISNNGIIWQENRLNILFLQYLISDMNNNKIDLRDFLGKLVNNLINYMPVGSFIILNDINHFSARGYFEYLFRLLSVKNEIIPHRFHFNIDYRQYTHQYGVQHKNNAITTKVPVVIRKYDPLTSCGSAQLVINKVGEK